MTPLFFIEQHEIRFQLDGQGEGFGLAAIEVTAEDRNQRPAFHFMTIDPGGVLNLVTSRMSPSSLIELIPDTLGDVDPPEQLPQEIEVADGGKTGEG